MLILYILFKMKTQNSVLMQRAREALVGRWGLAIGTTLVYMVIISALNSIPKAGPLLSILVGGPMVVGYAIFVLAFSRNQNAKFDQLFQGFNKIGISLSAYLLTGLFTLLWTLLLVIPGIIAALSYSMTFYIIADDTANTLTARQAIDKSKKMMYGYKWKFFCLGLRFIGWAVLSVLTLGIGFLWLAPYMQVSMAKFYEDIKGGEGSVMTPQPQVA